nr:hypothetical protein [Angustibacter aerolatus]
MGGHDDRLPPRLGRGRRRHRRAGRAARWPAAERLARGVAGRGAGRPGAARRAGARRPLRRPRTALVATAGRRGVARAVPRVGLRRRVRRPGSAPGW